MHPNYKENMMVVMLNDVSGSILPMLVALKAKLEQGHALLEVEISLLSDCLHKVRHCLSFYQNDEHCRVIFVSTIHLLYEVITLALENEQHDSRVA